MHRSSAGIKQPLQNVCSRYRLSGRSKKPPAWSSEADVSSRRQTSEHAVKVGTFEDYLGVVLWLDRVFWHAFVIKNCEATAAYMQVAYSAWWQEKPRMLHTKTARTTSGGPRELGTNDKWSGGPRELGTNDKWSLWCFLVSVGLFNKLMMSVEVVEGKWIEFESRRNAISATLKHFCYGLRMHQHPWRWQFGSHWWKPQRAIPTLP